jgi:methylated-DNA-[protein]-cysteine S-methyltransferase
MSVGIGYIEHENLGLILIKADEKGITELTFYRSQDWSEEENETELIKECKIQLQEYFKGERKEFNLPLSITSGTEFQRKVWKELEKIPFGETVSYQDIAVRIDKPKACRAVGGANNKNKIGIIIPCHRVVGKNGSLTGYAGGTDKKEYLLNLEKGLL